MASALSASSCSTIASSNSRIIFFNNNSSYRKQNQSLNLYRIRASSSSTQEEEEDCNVEECAPDKEVGKVSMDWLAAEKTKVAGTYPPRKRNWSGYVEKDTAGQTNIYSVEPTIYVAESAISSGTSGTSSDGSENTAAITAGLALIFVAAASSILLQVGKNPPQIQTLEYSGPSLSYYISKFKPPETVQVSVPTEETESGQPESSSLQASVPTEETETSTSVQPESSSVQVSEVQVESG